MTTSTLTLSEATRIVREAVKDKSYQLLPLGGEAAEYLRHKRKRLTPSSVDWDVDQLASTLADVFEDEE